MEWLREPLEVVCFGIKDPKDVPLSRYFLSLTFTTTLLAASTLTTLASHFFIPSLFTNNDQRQEKRMEIDPTMPTTPTKWQTTAQRRGIILQPISSPSRSSKGRWQSKPLGACEASTPLHIPAPPPDAAPRMQRGAEGSLRAKKADSGAPGATTPSPKRKRIVTTFGLGNVLGKVKSVGRKRKSAYRSTGKRNRRNSDLDAYARLLSPGGATDGNVDEDINMLTDREGQQDLSSGSWREREMSADSSYSPLLAQFAQGAQNLFPATSTAAPANYPATAVDEGDNKDDGDEHVYDGENPFDTPLPSAALSVASMASIDSTDTELEYLTDTELTPQKGSGGGPFKVEQFFGPENEGGAILKGVDVLANAVRVTLGPKGRNVIIEQSFGGPKITKGGVTVAKAITLKDKYENLDACLVQDVAQKMNEIAGDGTTTATVLARAIYSEGVTNVAAGCNPEFLSSHTKTITTTAEIAQVATISANDDTHVGNLIARQWRRLERRVSSPSKRASPTSSRKRVEFEKPFILLPEKKISLLQDILPTLEPVAPSSSLLRTSTLQIAAVKPPGFGDNRKSILGDLAILTGGAVFTDELRYDDALNATRTALATNSPGSGAGSPSSLVSNNPKPIHTTEFDQELGVAIIRRAMTTSARAILNNAGEEASVIVGTLLKQYGSEDKFAWGYDAAMGKYVDMIKSGIVDPLKVMRMALVDVGGVASLLTTSECCVVDEDKPPVGVLRFSDCRIASCVPPSYPNDILKFELKLLWSPTDTGTRRQNPVVLVEITSISGAISSSCPAAVINHDSYSLRCSDLDRALYGFDSKLEKRLSVNP
ncbi:hypothetical protein BDZ97DRAFT_1914286 [Flammula alnicola]|nr:hypothetical protein BDZ97DRAFT_1914286 [Flammula alnicola]